MWNKIVCNFQESSEFESSYLLPEESNGGFPGHITEGKLGGSQVSIDLDSAVEALEGSSQSLDVLAIGQQSLHRILE